MKTVKHQARVPFLILILFIGAAPQSTSQRAAAAQSACAHGTSFVSARHFAVGRNQTDVSVGDFNADGWLDLAISHLSPVFGGQISIFAGNGRGEFVNVHGLPLSSLPFRLAHGDFNNDGQLDLATTVAGDESGVVIALGRGDWTFTTRKILAMPVRFHAGPAVADFNADGKADIAFSGAGSLQVINGNGDGTFAPPVSYNVGGTPPGAVMSADFSGDGKLDLLVLGEFYESRPTLFINDGAGRFAVGMPLNHGVGGTARTALGDFNGDGKIDLAYPGASQTTRDRGVSIIFNTGGGAFGEPALYPTSLNDRPVPIAADFNGDGKLDLAATEDLSNRVVTLLGDGGGAFALRGSYSGGAFPVASAAGDFNHDGKPDLAVLNGGSDDLTIMLGLGDGRLQAQPMLDLEGYSLTATALADLDRDSRLDVAALSIGLQGLLVARGDGAGGFAAPKIYNGGRDNNDVTVADFNKDGNPDIVVAGGNTFQPQTTSGVNLLLGIGAGDFAAPRQLTAGQVPSTAVNADLNGDGNLDLIIGNFVSNDISIFLGNGRGEFAPAMNIPVGPSPAAIAPGDFDRDGKLDLAVANYGGNTLTLLKGDGAGGFSPSSIAVTAAPLALAATDFNGDATLDLAVVHRDQTTTQNLSVLLGNGDGSFRAPLGFTTGAPPASMATGDFTGDGKLDLALIERFAFARSGFTDRVRIYASDGAGNFARALEIPVTAALYLVAGDLNNDGLTDLVVTTHTGLTSVLSVCNLPPAPVLTNVSAASYQPLALAPDSIASAFGSRLTTTTESATSLPLPTELAGTRVQFRDALGSERPAPLFFVSPGQVNYLVPPDIAPGLATVTVTSGDGLVTTGIVAITLMLPGLFTANADGSGPPAGYLVRIKPNGAQTTEPLAEFDPAQNRFVPRPIAFFSDSPTQPDDIILVLFGTGLRQRGSPADVAVIIGGSRAELLYAGPQSSFIGLDQINVRLPQFRNRPLADIIVVVDGKISNAPLIEFK